VSDKIVDEQAQQKTGSAGTTPGVYSPEGGYRLSLHINTIVAGLLIV
jgi:hypothetical protein